jgi:hypothetical protein
VKRLVRSLAALHRWLGTLFCIPFAVWFLSGIVMAFVGFPGVSPGERLTTASALTPSSVRVGAAEAAAKLSFVPERISLVVLDGRPTWRFTRGADFVVVSAEDAAVVSPLDEAAALRVAAEFLDAPLDVSLRHERLDEPDQWTPHAIPNRQLPLLRVHADDDAGTEVYVSLPRARVIQRTTTHTRLAAWLGAIPHWWYPIALRRHAAEWELTVLIGAGLGTALCVLGLLLGLLRVSRQPAAADLSRRWSPYKAAWLRWHHLFGLAFGAIALTWVFSGMLSLNPGSWSTGSGPSPAEERAFQGTPAKLDDLRLGAREAIERCSQELEVKSLELVQSGGRAHWLCASTWDSSFLIDAATPHAHPQLIANLDSLTAAARASVPAALLHSAIVSGPDDYVYPTHLDAEVRFPLLRLEFENGTWLYIDPHSVSIVRRYDATSRAERWLYQGLHRLDVAPLYGRRWLWTCTVVGLCAIGAGFSLTGIVLGTRWVGAHLRRIAAVRGERRR